MKNYSRVLAVLALGIIISLLSYASMQAQDNGLAPDFTLPDLNQKRVNLSAYKDKHPVVLLFWTTWCPYCQKALKDLSDMYPALKKDGWELLAIDVGEASSKVANFVKRNNIVSPVLLDEGGEVADSYGLLGVPTYFIVDKQGTIRFKQNYFPKDRYKQIISE